MSQMLKPHDDDAVLPCVRCGADGVAVWKACADKDWRVLCVACDIDGNDLLMRFMKVSQPTQRLNRYKKTMDIRPVTRARMIRSGLLSIDGSTLR